jgi:hypothetical protein
MAGVASRAVFLGVKVMDPKTEQKYRDEAERLAALPQKQRAEFMAAFRTGADDPKLSQRERKLARERVEALEALLGMTGKAGKAKRR